MSRLKLATMEPFTYHIEAVAREQFPDEVWVLFGHQQEHAFNHWRVFGPNGGGLRWTCAWWGRWEYPGKHRTLSFNWKTDEAMYHRTYHMLIFRHRCKQLRS